MTVRSSGQHPFSCREDPDVSIIIPTFYRPALLRQALQSCLDQRTASGRRFEILVVDNAPDPSALPVVAEVSETTEVPIRYAHEPRPGISHARNTGIASARGRLLALIDDDERASADWLWHLTRVQQEHHADVVFGPVHPEFEPPPRRHADFLTRFYTYTVRRPTGQRVGERSTNNALVRRTCIRTGQPFDPRLGLTGGEDTLFFSQLQADGARFVWCAEACVTETIPPERTSWRYLWRRSFRRGQCRASTPTMLDPPRRMRAVLWMGIGAFQLFGLLPLVGLLWLVRSKNAPYCTAKMIGGFGKILWMRQFQRRSYGAGPEST